MGKRVDSATRDRVDRYREYELLVAKYYKKIGWEVEENIFYDEMGNETWQSKIYNGSHVSYPDLTCVMNKSGVNLLVEVKSNSYPYVNSKGFLDSYGIDNYTQYLYMKQSQFYGYGVVLEAEKLPIEIVYYITHEDYMYFANYNKLDRNKVLVRSKLYEKGVLDDYYLWEKKLFRRDRL